MLKFNFSSIFLRCYIWVFLAVVTYIVIFAIYNPAIATTIRITEWDRAELRLSIVDNAVYFFWMNVGRYPTTNEGIDALYKKPKNESSEVWLGPYLYSHHRKDLWGQDYGYIYPGIHNKYSFDLFSLGRDGIEGTIDDINNWDENRPWREYYKKTRYWKEYFYEYPRFFISLVGGLLIGVLFTIVQEIRQRKRSKNERA